MNDELAVFDENLIAVKGGIAQVFNFDFSSREYISHESIVIPAGVGLPAASTTEAPPGCDVNQVAVRMENNAGWYVTDDYRGVVVYDIQTQSSLIISELGPIPDTVTRIAPETPYDKWDGSAWVTDVDAQHIEDVETAEKQKSELLAKVSAEISILQDAVNLDMATSDEVARLRSLQTYRVLLNRVDTSLAPDIEWPAMTTSSAETEVDNG